MTGQQTPLVTRFARYIPLAGEQDCWEWQGGRTGCGYGAIAAGGRSRRMLVAHRVSWEMKHGPIPEGLVVCHRCDNPPCVNPSHLFLGYPSTNTRDMMAKSRDRMTGVRNAQAKLTWDEVRQIRWLRAKGVPRRLVAYQFGMSEGMIKCITSGRNWKEV